MARLFAAALFSVVMLGGTGGAARAQSFGIGFGLDFTFSGSGASPDGGGGGSGCRTCFVPGWSPCYPKPKMYGGLLASAPYQGGYPTPYPAYGYAPMPGYYYGWTPAPAALSATPGISTVPPPEPATGSRK